MKSLPARGRLRELGRKKRGLGDGTNAPFREGRSKKRGRPRLPDSRKFTVSMAGWVGFEPTICGSAGRRLSPGSTTSPKPRTLSFPYNALTKEPRHSLINGNGFAKGASQPCSYAQNARSASFNSP